MTQLYDCRDAFNQKLRELASEDRRIVAVVNDSVGSSKLNEFGKMYPIRLVNVGIAEQNMVGVGAGLANGGLVPFVSAAAPFLTGRALEQIKADAAYSDVPVILCGQSPGMAYGELGPTHHSIEDLAWTRAIANLTVLVPADPAQTRAAVRWAAAADVPCYLRIPRFKVPDVTPDDAEFAPGTAVRLAEGDDVAVIATGTMVSRALEAAERLRQEGIGVRVLNFPFIEPLDEQAIVDAALQTRGIVTVEEATITGGLGAAVANVIVEHHPVPMRLLGIRRTFAPTGSPAYLLDHFGLNAAGIVQAAREILESHGA
jgi:transketolase